MDTIQIPCPKCGRELKLRDRSLLGRKGKCPKCEHAFVLEEPAVVELELADPSPLTKAAARGNMPVVTAPRAQVGATQQTGSAAGVAFPDLNGFVGSTDGAAARLKAMQKKNAKRRNVGLAVGAVVLAAVGGVTFYAVKYAPEKPTVEVADAPPDRPEAADDGPDAGVAYNAKGTGDFSDPKSPTKGKPIELQYIPYGTQIVLNIRPAELWKNDGPGKEFRYCIPPLAKLVESAFEDLFKRKPEQVEEAQICLIPGMQGTLPDVAAVIHLVDEAKKSQLLEDFGGERIDDFGHPVYISGDRAYLIADQKTIAVCPKSQAKEMVDAIVGRSLTDGIDELLPMTDRERHVTCIVMPRAVRQHAAWWFPDNLRPLALNVCNWFGDEVETIGWSVHLGDKGFYSEMILRNVTGVTSARLERDTRGKLDKLPAELLESIQKMNPREMGKRKVIGRVPKMSEVFSLASLSTHGPRHVQIVTPLPERAAPNLALGILLAWDESTRTNFSKEKSKATPTAEEVKVPELVADRLKMKIDVEFNREPLQGAYAFVANEIKTKIDIDGDALKAGGYTKNMPQSFKMDKATAQDVIAKLLEKYQDTKRPPNHMVVVIDEAKKTILITTQAFAEAKNMTTFDVFKK